MSQLKMKSWKYQNNTCDSLTCVKGFSNKKLENIVKFALKLMSNI